MDSPRCVVCGSFIAADDPAIEARPDGRVAQGTVDQLGDGEMMHRACLTGWVRHGAPTAHLPQVKPRGADPESP